MTVNIDSYVNAGFPPNPVDKPGYRLEFNDNFRGESLDTSKWLPFYLPQWSNRQLAAARYSLSSNGLRLLIERDQQPWCPGYDGAVRVSSLQTGCYSGPLGSPIGQHRFNPELVVTEWQPTLKLYTPHYGYFETRLKALPIPGYMVALWMIGFEQHPEQSDRQRQSKDRAAITQLPDAVHARHLRDSRPVERHVIEEVVAKGNGSGLRSLLPTSRWLREQIARKECSTYIV
ncbi:MAG: glycoside hydrolase family 16 protein [Anaerolineales bacterium]